MKLSEEETQMSVRSIKRISLTGLAFALPVLFFAAPLAAQQDTTRAGQGMMMRRGMHRGMHQGQGMMRGEMPGARMMGANHIGPRLLLGLKSELELSNEQASRLEKIQEDHHALMQGMHENMMSLRERTIEARGENDWDALEDIIEERSKLHEKMAKSHLNVERQALGVLSDDQRQKVETWQEGHRLFRQQRMEGMMNRPGMMREGERMRRQSPRRPGR